MKLNKSQKGAFVEAVMQDIPSVDCKENVRSLVIKAGLKTLPPEILAIHSSPALTGYLEQFKEYIPGVGYVYYYAAIGWETGNDRMLCAAIKELTTKGDAQAKQRCEIKEKLEGVIASCTTLKQAEALLPEFVKYLPTDTGNAVDRSMPVITDLVATLTAAGWPKDAEVAEQLAA